MHKNSDSDWGDHWKRQVSRIKTNITPMSKLTIDKLLARFAATDDTDAMTFSPTLTSAERAYIHRTVAVIGWQSGSSGKDDQRCITIRKPKETTECCETLLLCKKSYEIFDKFKPNIQPEEVVNSMTTHTVPKAKEGLSVEKLGYGPPKVPRPKSKRADTYERYRQSLPIWNHRKDICNTIKNNAVTFIKGDTGCGKTTQVAQYILDEAESLDLPVRIICTVPRRLAAISISERVAVERGERVASTVGYQIRLDRKLSRTETLLTYCTSGILLRSITSPDSNLLRNLTHIIIDEVHERDRHTDFALSCLKSMMHNYKNLRLILMGADLNVELFTNYFGGSLHCPTIHVEGRTYPVETLFLEDVLEAVGFTSDAVFSAPERNQNAVQNGTRIKNGVNNGNSVPTYDPACHAVEWEEFTIRQNGIEVNVNDLIELVFRTGDPDSFDTFVDLVMKNVISVDCKHSDPDSDITMLMAISAFGDFYRANTLIQMGANVNIRSTGAYPFTAKEWAAQYDHVQLARMLESKELSVVNDQKIKVLNEYLKDLDTDKVDLLLAYKIIYQLHNSQDRNKAILVFLPGYEEMAILKGIIMEDELGSFNDSYFEVHMLHSSIQTGDQRAVFDRPRRGIRKIILSTNIAESSLTIKDIVFVVDSGKVKEKSYDALTGVTQLKSVWISKASANQRKGRAGRCQPGVCYRMYSTEQYNSMDEFPTPEIIRTSLHELCLNCRSFLKPEISIEHFFSLIPQPPAPIAVEKAVKELIYMGALDKNEYLTDLGVHLVDFPLEPRLGKALIYSIVFKCLNPILIIVSALSHKDPFQLPSNPTLKTLAKEKKRKFAEGYFSDHKTLLALYQEWERAANRGPGYENEFCRSNFVSSSALNMIQGIKDQLLQQIKTSGFVRNQHDIHNLNSNSENWTVVKAVLTAMLYPSLCCVRSKKRFLFNRTETKIMFHASTTVHARSSNWSSDIPTKWVLYDELTKIRGVSSVCGCTMVTTPMVALMAGNFMTPTIGRGADTSACGSQDSLLKIEIDDWLSIEASERAIAIILQLRKSLDNLVVNKLKDPAYNLSQEDSRFVSTVVRILTEEDINPELNQSSNTSRNDHVVSPQDPLRRHLVHIRKNTFIVAAGRKRR